MSIVYNNTEEKTELQQKIMAELRQKQATKPLTDGASVTSLGDDYVKSNMSRSTMWIIVLVIAVIASIAMLVAVM